MLRSEGEYGRGFKRLGLLVLIMAVVAATIGGTAIAILYGAAFDSQRLRLIDIVRSQASLMEAVARFDRQYTSYPGGARLATLTQIEGAGLAAAERPDGSDLRLLVGQNEGNGIRLHGARLADGVAAGSAAADAVVAADWPSVRPLRLALSGETGTMLATGLDGEAVLVAYQPVRELELGLAAEIPVEEIRAPFVEATEIVTGITVALVAGGSALFFAVGEPIVRRLRESETLYRRLFDESPSPKFILDPASSRFVRVNDALVKLLGYPRSDLARLPLSTYAAREPPEATDRRVAEILEREKSVFETAWQRKDGGILVVTIHASVLEMDGRPMLHCVVADLTARVASEKRVHELQDQVQRATRANELGQMASSLTHEIKQPLTAALNYTNACRRFLQSNAHERAAKAAGNAAEQIGRADQFVRGLRDYMQHKDPVRTVQDVNSVVLEAVELAAMDTANVDVRLALARGLPPVSVDRMQIQQVLLNVLRNACEALADALERRITIETGGGETGPGEIGPAKPDPGDAGSLVIVVSDTGPGLPPDMLDRPFAPFVTTKPDGLGIGLAISSAIVRAHDGRLSADNAAEGGARFRICLPAALPAVSAVARVRRESDRAARL